MFKNSHSLVEAVLRMYETSKNSILFEKYEKQLRARTANKDSIKKHAAAVKSVFGGAFGAGAAGDELGAGLGSSSKARKVILNSLITP